MNILKEDLNPVQQQAARILEGPVLVIAGAGSGKTRTLTYRTANLINSGAAPENILTVTFTNRAAKDMNKKIKGLIGEEKTKGMWLGTFHSICLKILRKYLHKVDRSEGCLIYGTQDSIDIVEDIVFEYELNHEDYNPRILFNIIQKAKMELVNPVQLIENYAKESQGSQHYYQNVQRVYREYERVLYNNNSFDFNDLIKKTIELFRQDFDILKKYQNKFKYVQVDEYQDVNHSQYRIVNMLSRPEKNIFVVGDDWQGIYGFRGADITNILEFEQDYPQAEIIKLEQNYRSTNNIINVSNSLIKNNSQNKEKAAWTEKDDGAPIFVAQTENPQIEARYVARRINDLVNHYNYNYSDISVLSRTNFQNYYIQRAFPKAHIPYQIVGGVSFFDRQEIKYFVNYLRLLLNPNDGLALKRIFKKEAEGVGEILLSEMNKYADQHHMDITDVFENATVIRGIGKKKGDNVIAFKRDVIESLNELRNKRMPIDKKVLAVYEAVNFKEKILDSLGDVEQREKYIDLFMNDIESYRNYNPSATLYDYMLINKLIGDQDQLDDEDEDTVKVMTAHTSKGLEFPVVFIIAAEEDVFPHQKSLEEKLSGNNPYAIEEERRLFYVAMTRAQKVLFISFSKTKTQNYEKGQIKQITPSRFLTELPKERLDLSSVKGFKRAINLNIRKDNSIL
ncbi:MAG: ATP-dependent helicase [Halothermotrichaceae bacterium]